MSPFEVHAAKWSWTYDNAGKYDGESWSWYYSPRYHFGRGQHIILARKDETGAVVAVHFDGTTPHEIGCGGSSESDVEALMAAVDAYVAAQNFAPGDVKKAWWKFR